MFFDQCGVWIFTSCVLRLRPLLVEGIYIYENKVGRKYTPPRYVKTSDWFWTKQGPSLPQRGWDYNNICCNCIPHKQTKISNHVSFGNFLTVHANMFPLNIVKSKVRVKACIKVIAKILKQGSRFVARTQTCLNFLSCYYWRLSNIFK